MSLDLSLALRFGPRATLVLALNLALSLALRLVLSLTLSMSPPTETHPYLQVICGFNRSFGMRLPNGERREWLKPIMFSAGEG